MKNLIIILSALALVLLLVVAYRFWGNSASPANAQAEPSQEKVALLPLEQPKQAALPKDPNKQIITNLVANAQQAEKTNDLEQAARIYQKVLEELAKQNNPWTNYANELNDARERHAKVIKKLLYNPMGEWRSAKYTVSSGDSLVGIRQRYVEASGLRPVTVGMIKKANGLQSDVIHPGNELRIPQGQYRIIIDRAAFSLRFYFDDLLIGFYRVGLGAENQETPEGAFTVGNKQNNPTWFPRGKTPVPYGDPENPLGPRWITLQGRISGYGIHGTNDDKAVGASISQGCIRMYNQEVEELSELVPVGAQVEIR